MNQFATFIFGLWIVHDVALSDEEFGQADQSLQYGERRRDHGDRPPKSAART